MLDLTRLYPGPLAAMLMGGMGAEIIKVEDAMRPDYLRSSPPFHGTHSAAFLATNHGKKSLALALDTPAGKALLVELVKTADVFLEGFRPGVMAKLGLDYLSMRRVNPKLVYVSLTGYGQTGPYANQAGHDLNYAGYSGILDTTGTAEKPIAPGVQMADVAGGTYMSVIGCLAALHARAASGEGQHVDVAMLDGVLPLASLQYAHHQAMNPPLERGKLFLSGATACYGIYACADGKQVVLGALEIKFWQAFCQLIERPDWVQRHLAQGPANDELAADLKALFVTGTRDEWVARAGAGDACLTPLKQLDELADDPHLKHREMIVQHQTEGGSFHTIGTPVKFSGTPAKAAERPAPDLGADSTAVLRELGYSDKEITRFFRDGTVYTHNQ